MSNCKDEFIICKCQRPLMDSDGNLNQVLIYNEERSVEFVVELDNDSLKEIFPNDEFKTYWACSVDEENYLVPVKQVEVEEW